MHHATMIPSVWPFEPRDPNYRTGMHRGPSFLPWHREFLLQVEMDLRTIDSWIFDPLLGLDGRCRHARSQRPPDLD